MYEYLVEDRKRIPRLVAFCTIGLLFNLIMSKIVLFFHLPIYLDCIGTILVGAVAGVLPGMIVGFLSNTITSLIENNYLFYGIVSVAIACVSTFYSSKGYFKSFWGFIKILVTFILIVQIISFFVNWILYGLSIGGANSELAMSLYKMGVPTYVALFITYGLIEIPDKVISLVIVFFVLHFYPKKMKGWFYLSYIYDGTGKRAQEASLKFKHPLNRQITIMILTSILVTSISAITIGAIYHTKRLLLSYEEFAIEATGRAATLIDGNKIDFYLAQGENSEEYQKTKAELIKIHANSKLIKYLFVYKPEIEGARVVFDLDTPELKADPVGTLITELQGFSESDKMSIYQGLDIPPMFSHGMYGRLMTIFSKVLDSNNNVTAYVGLDIDMNVFWTEIATYVMQMLSLVYIISIIIYIITNLYSAKHITNPIHTIINQTRSLDKLRPENWIDSPEWKNRVKIETGDEIEELYETVFNVAENASLNTKKLIETEQELLQTKELERINKELADMMKIANEANQARNDFFARMSHDLRTPMNGVLGMVRLSKDETDVNILKENLKKIEDSGSYLLGLINDSLDYQRIDAGKLKIEMQTVDANSLLADIFTMINSTAMQKNVNFKLNSGNIDINMRFKTDPLRLKQIIVNLLSNAVKFTPDGGTVELNFELLKREGNISHDLITVSDTGVGMSPEFIKNRLFKPFSQELNEMTGAYAGSGLGLSIVKRLVDMMGGRIDVESKLGVGTKFLIYMDFERVDEKLVQKSELENNESKEKRYESLKGINILLAEDNSLNAEIARRLLEKVGCNVTWVKDGKECVDYVDSSKEKQFDVILMDIRMPNMDGLQATKEIRSLKKSYAKTIPILAMSANAYEEDVQKSLESGMNAHLSKPIDPDAMYNGILNLVKK